MHELAKKRSGLIAKVKEFEQVRKQNGWNQ